MTRIVKAPSNCLLLAVRRPHAWRQSRDNLRRFWRIGAIDDCEKSRSTPDSTGYNDQNARDDCSDNTGYNDGPVIKPRAQLWSTHDRKRRQRKARVESQDVAQESRISQEPLLLHLKKLNCAGTPRAI
jgi:hypothetical protein